MQRPNIVVIITDQQSADAVAFASEETSKYLKTPHLDRLAREGLFFERATCAHPLCVPSRTSMVTGRYPHQSGVIENSNDSLAGQPCLGRIFADAGYDTGYVGKWHFGFRVESEREQHGFRYTANIRANGADAGNVTAAAQFIDEPREAPFLLVASYNNPHNICEWARNAASGADQELPDGNVAAAPSLDACPPLKKNHAPQLDEPKVIANARIAYQASAMFPVAGFGEKEWREYRWAYYRMIEQVDAEIGKLLDHLDSRGLAQETMIVFLSDHGDAQGAHRWNQKTVLIDESVRVPFIIKWPGQVEPARSTKLIHTGVDLLPTLCAAASIELDGGFPGLNALAESAGGREYVVTATKFAQGAEVAGIQPIVEGRMVRSARYKYCVYRQEGCDGFEESFVDMETDPGESVNEVGRPEWAEKVVLHRDYLRRYAVETNDLFALAAANSLTAWEPRPGRFDREAWAFAKGANAIERERQKRYQQVLAIRRGLELIVGSDVFISEMATINRGRLQVGDRSCIGSECQVGGNVVIGWHCTLNAGAVVRGTVHMGNGVRIATGAQIIGMNHIFADTSRMIYEQGCESQGIEIGDDVWIGANAVIVDGVKVGSHSVIAAGAIVTKDVEAWSILGGNPAKKLRDRRETKKAAGPPSGADLKKQWAEYVSRVRGEIPQVLTHFLHPETREPLGSPNQRLDVRRWGDYSEIAVMFGMEPPRWSRVSLAEKIRFYQDPVTGLSKGEQSFSSLEEALQDRGIRRMTEPQELGYGAMVIGYSNRILGQQMEHPIHVAAKLRGDDLLDVLRALPWKDGAWGAGSWVDHYATALAFNQMVHGIRAHVEELFGWLHLNCNSQTGMWGDPTAQQGWLQPVNGFYRLTRGSYAQWNVPLPYPERTIDTVLAHASDPRAFAAGIPTACSVLDIIHPLWLCLRQTDYRRSEAGAVATHWLERSMSQWGANHGFAFDTRLNAIPSLQGTEMWLSIQWFCADLLGWRVEGLWRPQGVHRPEPMLQVQKDC